jgi:hypothetical protein
MSTPVRTSDRDLRALAAIISEHRPDLPDGEVLPPSLLTDLTGQIHCDVIAFEGIDSLRLTNWFWQGIPDDDGGELLDRAHWAHYRSCRSCSYPDYSGDERLAANECVSRASDHE